ncbi:ABC1 kinase family protein [Motilibacter deserti]|uniref:AarF/ABC1/UbiB kinase family protein n=1 Tax=Motilibacter deserti TaxID=2714956 RepID=A0ABX0H350_9ACTN|nr:AarF/UbiB family protein [Motilibacter deserti]NHC16380.1 AarF/ABC1/UbiB kinase family protein [Motilibacter deserti]
MTLSVLYVALATSSIALGVVVFSAAARRLLGVRVGVARAFVTGTVGLVAFWAFGTSTESAGSRVLFTPVQIGVSLLVATLFLGLSEVLWPSPFRPLAGARGLQRRLARTRRYWEISRIAMRHGLLAPRLRPARASGAGDRRDPRALRLALEEGGVTFIKLGQALSTRPDLLPPDVVAELVRLRCEVPPAPWPAIEHVLREELGCDPEELFAHVDPIPLATASIAQVHRARLHTGEQVALKIQRPGIKPVVLRDLDIAHRVAKTLESRTTWGRRMGASALADGLSDALREELDFRMEARNLSAVAAATKDASVHVPRVHAALCSERLLVMEFLEGVPLGSAAAIEPLRALDRDALAATLLRTLLGQVLHSGVFHADPHPGNVLLLPDGRLGLLDFGCVGRLDGRLRSALAQFLHGLHRGDPARLVDALLEILTPSEDTDSAALERSLGQFLARHLGPGSTPGVAMFNDLFRLVSRHGLSVPPEIAAVFRSLTTLDGTLRELAPGLDMVQASRSFAVSHIGESFSPGNLRRTATEEALELLPMLRRLPRRIERILGAVEDGNVNVNVRLFASSRDRSFITDLLHQVLLGFLGASTGVAAVMLLGTPGGPSITPALSLFQLLGYNLLVVSSVLVMRVLFLSFPSAERGARGSRSTP